MSEWVIALLREAYQRVPNMEDRAAYCLKRQAEFFRNEHVQPPKPRGVVVPFAQVADDPVIARLCREDE